MKKLRTALLAVACALTLVGVSTVPAEAASPGWIVQCAYSHSLPDDPLVYPGQPGASHLHDFIGNNSTNGLSTYDSMTAGTTSCPSLSGDTAGYWAPALYKDGVKVNPAGTSVTGRRTRQKFYYRKYGTAPVTPFPPGFAMILGNSKAANLDENPLLKAQSHIYYGCSNNTGPSSTPKDCPTTGIMTLHFEFPTCWDGSYTPGVNEVPQMKYPSSGVCPSGYTALPRLIQRFEWPVGTTTGTITLASGGNWTAHADFWNTYQQSRLEELVATCLNVNTNCGTFS